MRAWDMTYVRPGESGQLITHDFIGYNGIPADLRYESENGTVSIEPDGSWKAEKTGEDWIRVLPEWDEEEIKAQGLEDQPRQQLSEDGTLSRIHVFVTEDIPVWSLRNPQTDQYLLTDSRSEWGWLMEEGWERADDPFVVPSDSDQKIIRLNSPDGSDTIYTMDADEIEALSEAGWSQQETRMTSDPQQSVPVYRFSQEMDGMTRHFYTTQPGHWNINPEEWQHEGIAFYAIRTPLYDDEMDL